MKKVIVFASSLLLFLPCFAQEETVENHDREIINLFTSDQEGDYETTPGTPITWGNTIEKFNAGMFKPEGEDTEQITLGDYLQITYRVTGPGSMELKPDGYCLGGSHVLSFDGPSADNPRDYDREYRVYLTQKMIDTLKDKGLEICGTGFNLVKAGIHHADLDFAISDSSVWGGFYWVENKPNNFQKLSIYSNDLKLDDVNYITIYFSPEKVQDDIHIEIYVTATTYNQDNVENPTHYLTDPFVSTNLNGVNVASIPLIDNRKLDFGDNPSTRTPTLNIEMKILDKNNEADYYPVMALDDGEEESTPVPGFNVQGISFTNNVVTGIDGIKKFDNRVNHGVYNLYGVKVCESLEDADRLPAAIYIANGKKYIIK